MDGTEMNYGWNKGYKNKGRTKWKRNGKEIGEQLEDIQKQQDKLVIIMIIKQAGKWQ